jgi:hypothetical protein
VKRRTLFLALFVLALLALVYLALYVADDCQSRWSAISEADSAIETSGTTSLMLPALVTEGWSRLS